ncbi:MAG: PorV/PorQ family protein [Candidatus Poribacteria bacterium]
MQRKFYSFMIAVFMVFVIACAGFAEIPDKIGTEDAAFLKIEPATRPVAMGGAFAGLANDVNAIFWNPAGLTQVEKKELTTMYNRWLANIRYASAAYAQNVGKGAAVGVSVQGLWTEYEKRTGDTEEPESTTSVYSYAAGLSGSYALVPNALSLGGTVKFLNQDFDGDSSNGVCADIGGLVHVAGLRVGISAQNLKLQMSNETNLPTGMRIGGSYQLDKDSVVAVEYSKYGSADPSYHLGIEKWFKGIIALRLGYNISSGDNPRKGLSAGIGLRAYGTKPLDNMDFQLDYAYVPAPDWGSLGDTHRISMLVRF